jgi:hypothetical protein
MLPLTANPRQKDGGGVKRDLRVTQAETEARMQRHQTSSETFFGSYPYNLPPALQGIRSFARSPLMRIAKAKQTVLSSDSVRVDTTKCSW